MKKRFSYSSDQQISMKDKSIYSRCFHFLKMVPLFFFIVCFLVNCSIFNPQKEEETPLKRLWLTFLGGEGLDAGYCLGIDPTGYIYITGSSEVDWWNDLYQQAKTKFVV
jgi:hypothetical protein